MLYKIYGAGLAGLACAIKLKLLGAKKVIVYEKGKYCGSKYQKFSHTLFNYYDGIDDVIEYYRTLGFNIINTSPCYELERRTFNNMSFTTYRADGKPIVYNILRGGHIDNSLDHCLFKQAVDLGVEFSFSTKAVPEEMHIISTGTKYRHLVAFGKHYQVENRSLYKNTLIMFHEKYHYRGGYIYYVPFNDNQFTIALFSEKTRFAKKLPSVYKQMINDISFFNKQTQNAKETGTVAGYGGYTIPKQFVNKKQIYIGESLGLLTADYGFGVHLAILSGNVAAECIIHNDDYAKIMKPLVWKYLWEPFKKRLGMKYSSNKSIQNKFTLIHKTFQTTRIEINDYNTKKVRLNNNLKSIIMHILSNIYLRIWQLIYKYP